MTKVKKKYRPRFYLENGIRLRKTFLRKTDSDAWLAEMRVKRDRGELRTYVNKSEPILMSDLAKRWLDIRVRGHRARKTVLVYESTLKANILPVFGNMKCDQVASADLEKFISDMIANGLKPKTINRIGTVLRQLFLFALDQDYIKILPIRRTMHVKVVKTKFDFYEEGEIRQLLFANRSDPIFPILYLALHTGMRLGEILGLCWDRVNFFSSRIEVTRTLSRFDLEEKTKGGKIRHFPMNQKLREAFEELRRNQKNPRFVFIKEDGSPYNPDHFSERYFKKACERAQVRRLRFHDLRHTFASHFMMKGGNIIELKELLGHSRVEMTMIYAHLSPEHLRKASEIVDFNIGFLNHGPDMDPGKFQECNLNVISNT